MDYMQFSIMLQRVFQARWLASKSVWRINFDDRQFDVVVTCAPEGSPHEFKVQWLQIFERLIDQERSNGTIPIRQILTERRTPFFEAKEVKLLILKALH